MKFLCLFMMIFVPDLCMLNNIEITQLRKLYYEASANRIAVKKLSTLLHKVDYNANALLIGYKGASEMMEAKYAFNPITKLNKFNKGKNFIEAAIKKDPEQVEIRFIRFSIQTNLPSFLGYNEHVKTDKDILFNSAAEISDEQLKDNVINYLIQSKQCSSEEIKKLKNWQNT